MTIYQIIKLLALRHKLSRRDTWTREELKKHQERALRDLREYAYAYSPFYQEFHRGLFDAPLQALPTLTKRKLMENWDNRVTDRSVKLADVQSFLSNVKDVRLFR